MARPRLPVVAASEFTPAEAVLDRRHFLRDSAGALLAALGTRPVFARCETPALAVPDGEQVNTWAEITSYNNYLEFSSDKKAVRHLAAELTLRPWTLTVDGEVENPRTFDIDDLLTRFAQQDRVYRMRCVEGWSMLIPWQGFALCELLALVQPTSRARYVEFTSVNRPAEMIGQRQPSLQWPYREGLRIDEATHPLTLVATGLHGKPLPASNGAPLRVVVPWKYGFKNPKAITRMRLLEQQPQTSWQQVAASEYGFYGNVNPDVAHPRWSQRREVRIGEVRKRQTLMFNGYAEHVASLYRGMDLARDF